MAVVGTDETSGRRRQAGRVADPERTLVGRGVVRPGQPGDRVAGRAAHRLVGPEGVPGLHSRRAAAVVRGAVHVGPVGRVRRPVAGGRLQVRGVHHRARVPGRNIGQQFARSVQRDRRRVRFDRHDGVHDRRAPGPVRRHERAVSGHRAGVPRGHHPSVRVTDVPVGQRADG